MDIRLRAVGRTLGIFGFSLLGGILTYSLFQFDTIIILYVIMGATILWFLWLVYSISLKNLEDMEAIEAMLKDSEARLSKYSTKGEK